MNIACKSSDAASVKPPEQDLAAGHGAPGKRPVSIGFLRCSRRSVLSPKGCAGSRFSLHIRRSRTRRRTDYQCVPHCDVFALFDFLPESQRGFLKGKAVKTSFIQHLPFAKSKHRAYLPLMPFAIEQLDVSQYDLVISSSYVAAKGHFDWS